MKNLFKAILKLPKWAWMKVMAWVRKMHVSPITRAWCDKKLLEAANGTALYGLAKKAGIRFIISNSDDPLDPEKHITWGGLIDTVGLGGDETFIMSAPGFGFTFPWPDPVVRYLTETRANVIAEKLDSTIVQMIADKSLAKDRVFFKRCLTVEATKRAMEKLGVSDVNVHSFAWFFWDNGGGHYILVTSRKRIEDTEKRMLCDDPAWEDEMCYQNYIDRDLYPGEYGRLKIADGLYVVFLTTLDDRMMVSMLFGPDALTVTPLEKNLHTIFRRREMAERRVIDVGYLMQLGAVVDPARCVVLEAERPVEKV